MKRSEFEKLLCTAGKLSPEKEFIVFGSQALLGYMAKPPKDLLVSIELDLYPKHYPEAARLIEAELGRDSKFARKHAYYADYVSPELGTWPDGWMERLIRFEKSGVVAWCAELHDVAVSKLAAGRPKDVRYILALLRHKLIAVKLLRERIDLLPSESDQRRLHSGFDELLKEYRRRQRAQKVKPIQPLRRKK